MKCQRCGLENPPNAERCDCGYIFGSHVMVSQDNTPQGASIEGTLCIIGVLAILIGLAIAGYYGMFFETSIPSNDGDRILNFGLALERVVGTIGGLLVGVIGGQVMVFSRR